MEIRLVKEEDLSAVMKMIADAQDYLKEMGIPQWQNGYPDILQIRKDMESEWGHVLADKNEVIAYAAVIPGPDIDYARIDHGSWYNNDAYMAVHRVVVCAERKGQHLAAQLFSYARTMAEEKDIHNLRVDTHEKNRSMRICVERFGFKACGTVYINGTAPRVAYQLVF